MGTGLVMRRAPIYFKVVNASSTNPLRHLTPEPPTATSERVAVRVAGGTSR